MALKNNNRISNPCGVSIIGCENEFLGPQKLHLLSKKSEYAEWKSGYLDKLKQYEPEIKMAEMVLEDVGII